MADGASETETETELTDGFHLIIDALKLNGVENVYHVPGIPVTDISPPIPCAT